MGQMVVRSWGVLVREPMRKRARLISVVCVVGCGGSNSVEPTFDQVIQLTSPGAEPRRVVAFHPSTTTEAPVYLHYKRGSGSLMNIKVQLTPEPPHEKEAWRARFAVKSFTLDGHTLDGCYTELDGLIVADARGRAFATLLGNCSTNPSVPALLTMYTLPLPAEAIGPGATWHAGSPGERGMDYQLVDWTADGATIKWRSAASAPTKPNGDFGVFTQGKATIRFDDVLPVNGDTEVTAWTPNDKTADPPDHISIER